MASRCCGCLHRAVGPRAGPCRSGQGGPTGKAWPLFSFALMLLSMVILGLAPSHPSPTPKCLVCKSPVHRPFS